MNLFKGFGKGIAAYGSALSLMFSNGLGWYFLFPLALNLIFIIGGFYGVGELTSVLVEWIEHLSNMDNATFYGAAYLKYFVNGFVWVFLKVIFFFIFSTLGGYLIIILLSPVFALLSEKVEEVLTGNNYPFDMQQFLRDVLRGLIVAVRNMIIEVGFLIVFFILGFIPLIGQFAAIFLFLISSYFYGFAFIDYTNERRRLSIAQSVKFIRLYKGVAIGNGAVFALAMLIPFFGVTIAGFVAIVSVVAATISTHKIVDLSSNPYAKKTKIET